MSASENRRVAKNTLILYARMVFTMLIGMWTSRLVLNALGFTDQGLYNVVGGVIGFSSLITASISGSITRFITYETGKGNLDKVNRAVQNGISVQWILAVIVLIAGETIGLWFVNTHLVIPNNRILAVNWVYQFALLNITLSLLTSAPNALIIANERMNVYAGIAIVNSIVALLIAIAIANSSVDRLVLYSFLQFLNALGVRIFYYFYIKSKFSYLSLKFGFDKEIFLPIFSFAGWNGIGTTAAILRSSGTSVLLNIFGGPIANTINGIANSVNNLATIFVNDFTTAYTPQITKRYAAGEYQSLITFLHQCSKFSYSLIAIMSVPVMFNIKPLLTLWLKNIPDGVTPFAILIIVFSMIESLCRPLINAKNATGNIRNYQIIVGGILLLTLPITYVFLKIGLPIYYSYVSIVITSITAFVARMIMLKGSIPYWSSRKFILATVIPCFAATLLSLIIPATMHYLMEHTAISSIIQCAIGAIWTGCCLFIVAFNNHEKKAMIGIIKRFLEKFQKI